MRHALMIYQLSFCFFQVLKNPQKFNFHSATMSVIMLDILKFVSLIKIFLTLYLKNEVLFFFK